MQIVINTGSTTFGAAINERGQVADVPSAQAPDDEIDLTRDVPGETLLTVL